MKKYFKSVYYTALGSRSQKNILTRAIFNIFDVLKNRFSYSKSRSLYFRFIFLEKMVELMKHRVLKTNNEKEPASSKRYRTAHSIHCNFCYQRRQLAYD